MRVGRYDVYVGIVRALDVSSVCCQDLAYLHGAVLRCLSVLSHCAFQEEDEERTFVQRAVGNTGFQPVGKYEVSRCVLRLFLLSFPKEVR